MNEKNEKVSKGENEKTTVNKGEILLKVVKKDAGVGKTSLMIRLVDNTFEEDYVYTMGVTFREKLIKIKSNKIRLMIWDIGGQKQFHSMINRVVNDAHGILFCFDLSRPSSLTHVRQWYSKSRKENRNAINFLIGTKYDKFVGMSEENKKDITNTARKFASAMKASLVFCSAAAGINVKILFKIVLSKCFDIKPNIKEKTKIGEAIVELYN